MYVMTLLRYLVKNQNDHQNELGPVLYYALSIDPPLQLFRRKNLSPNSGYDLKASQANQANQANHMA